MVLTQEQLQKLGGINGVNSISMVVEEKAMLQNGEYQSMVNLKGVDDNYNKVTTVSQHIIYGEFNTGTADHPLLVLGAGIENAIGVVSDRSIFPIVLYLPRKGEVNLMNPMQSLSSDTIHTSGTFVIQQDFDNKYVITNVQFVKQMLGMNADHYSAAEVSIINPSDANRIQKEMTKMLGKSYSVQTRFQQNASLYTVMQMEKWIIYAILTLILTVAAFNMVGALTMLVLEKKQDIQVLHALGADKSFIQKIFLTEGVLLAIIGGGIGMTMAFIIAVLQINFHLIPLQGSTFMIDYFPVKMQLQDFLLVGGTVVTIALIASYIPAKKAAHQQFMMRSE